MLLIAKTEVGRMGANLAAINAFVKIKHFMSIIPKFVRCHFSTLYYKRAYKSLESTMIVKKINRKLVKLLRFNLFSKLNFFPIM